MICIYVSENSPRVEYIFDIFFKYILEVEFVLTSDKTVFTNFSGPKFSYGRIKETEGLFFGASDLMFENDVYKKPIEPVDWNNLKGFFPVKDLGFLPFDPFSSAFYIITRYEEHLITNTLDKYKRYMPEQSMLYTYNLIDKPIINLYALEIRKIILSFFSNAKFPERRARFIPTFDIDNAFAYKHKGFIRSSVAFLEDLLKFNFRNVSQRFLVHTNIKPDPYDTFKRIVEICDKFKIKPLFFFLIGDFGGNDRNISHHSNVYRSIIKKFNEKYEVGFHPSFGSVSSEKQLHVEKQRLENIIGKPVFKSRQYFNKITFPNSYNKLIDAGITDDYSMGYNNVIGFRSGICVSYPFFDLVANSPKPLMIHPFCFVDKAFKLHLRVRSSEVPYHARHIWETVKAVGGDFRVTFHNETLGSKKMWHNWNDICEEIIRTTLD